MNGRSRPDESSVQSLTVGKLSEAEPILFQQVLFLVCDELDVSPLAVLVADRRRPLPQARHMVAWLLCQWEGWTRRSVAHALGVNEKTVAYYLRNVRRNLLNGEWTDLTHRLSQGLASGAEPF
jgi:hypothetical protein